MFLVKKCLCLVLAFSDVFLSGGEAASVQEQDGGAKTSARSNVVMLRLNFAKRIEFWF